MNFFDLHCDTLYECVTKKQSLKKNSFSVSIEKGEIFKKWVQCFAIWTSDNNPVEASYRFVFDTIDFFYEELKENSEINFILSKNDFKKESKINAMLTVEGLHFVEKISDIEKLYEKGVRVATLTWNGSNKIGDGAKVSNPSGLSEFGIKSVKKMQELGLIIDISHASDPLFYDVSRLNLSRPIIATHSNSRKICSHKRNLTDDQFLYIKNSNGIVGLNFFKDFLNSEKSANLDDILLHAEHFLSLGGENVLCMGSDFDGITKDDLPEGIENGISSIPKLYEHFLKKFDENVVKNIFFNNAHNFFLQNL